MNEQLSFPEETASKNSETVVCLGKKFKSEKDRREYFLDQLREKLPELKKKQGYPVANDEDILALSDPPYYTACPNPWLQNFTEEWNQNDIQVNNSDLSQLYKREPYSLDVSVGKNDPIYNAHSYHTKVPYKAIMNYILHYTEPGDIILDGFSGTGMTGVAATLCGDEKILEELGFISNSDKSILNKESREVSKIGSRRTILNDLSPAAAFITYNYNTQIDVMKFNNTATQILDDLAKEYSWVYETDHDNDNKGIINYVVWSDVFLCNQCMEEIIFYDIAVDKENKKVKETFECDYCGAQLTKKSVDRAYSINYDKVLGKNIEQAKKVPVLINYNYGTKRFEKKPDMNDIEKITRINNMEFLNFFPSSRMPEGDESRRNDKIGITHVHHFYTKRNLLILSELLKRIEDSEHKSPLKLTFQSIVMTLGSQLVRYNMGNRGNGILSGTLYLSSMNAESNIFKVYRSKLKDFTKALSILTKSGSSVMSTQSLTELEVPENSVDYIFTDPPFGSNLMYSELNYIWEAWLKVSSNNTDEAIVNKTQRKGFLEYQNLMEKCFKVYYKALKPGRWMTVEFSNSQASVWNAIQEAIQKSGFVIASVSALDKKQGSFKAVTTAIAVKQDLVISAYKPQKQNIEEMRKQQHSVESAWIFVKQHLEQLPVFIGKKGHAQIITERTPRILFDRMVAYHVQNGLPIPISSADFQEGLAQKFSTRDGMIFLENQVAEYDKKRTLIKEFTQISLFVSDEGSAIEWIRQQLLNKAYTRQELHPIYMQEILHVAKHEMLPELDDLLNQNFLKYEGEATVPDQLASYLRKNFRESRGLSNDNAVLKEKALNRWYIPNPNKQADLEKLRERSLLREFEDLYKNLENNKKRKQFRTESIRVGFKKAWSDKDYRKIVNIGKILPESVIYEDNKLLMYYDNALVRLDL